MDLKVINYLDQANPMTFSFSAVWICIYLKVQTLWNCSFFFLIFFSLNYDAVVSKLFISAPTGFLDSYHLHASTV